MKIAICGIGGVGGLLAGVLAQQEQNLYLLARGDKKQALQEEGLLLKSDTLGERLVRAHVVERPEDVGVVDVLFLCTKHYGLAQACADCAPLVGETTLIIPLLNGIGVGEAVKEHLHKGRVAEGCIYCISMLDGLRQVRHIGPGRKLVFGFAQEEPGETELALVKLLQEGGMKTYYAKNVQEMVWEKFCAMCGNSTTFLFFDGPAGEIQASQEKLETARAIYTELWSIACANGVALSEEVVDKNMKSLLALDPETTTSLYRDLKFSKGSTELEGIIGQACRLAEAKGVQVPYLQQVYRRYQGR